MQIENKERRKEIDQLMNLKTELKNLFKEKLNREINDQSTQDLIDIKKDLVKWIQEDQSKLNQIDVIYIITHMY